MADTYDRKNDRWQRRFRYPRILRLLFLVPFVLAGAVVLLLTLDEPEAVFRLRLYLKDHPKVAYAALGGGILFSLWCLWTAWVSWASHIIVSPSSIKVSIFAHGRQRVSWEHVTDISYKQRLLGHTLFLTGSDGATVYFRSSIGGYDELIALIHRYAPHDVQAQLESLLSNEEPEEVERDEAAPEPQDENAPEPEDPADPDAPDR